jgi:hypothetical protein
MSKLSKRNRTRSSNGELRPFEGMSKVNLSTAGVDIGAHEIMACIPDGANHQIVHAFGTHTADLDALADWFLDHGIQEVGEEHLAQQKWRQRSRVIVMLATSPA